MVVLERVSDLEEEAVSGTMNIDEARDACSMRSLQKVLADLGDSQASHVAVVHSAFWQAITRRSAQR